MMDRLPDVMEGNLVRLRRVKPADAVRIHVLFNNWNIVRWLSRAPWPVPEEGTEAFISKMNIGADGEHYWAIERDVELLGGISVSMEPASHTQSQTGPHIGYWLGEPYWLRGYMSEAARLLVRAVFSAMPHQAIYSGVFEGNIGSLRIQEKLGFAIESRTTLLCVARNEELSHLNTVLTRDVFEKTNR